MDHIEELSHNGVPLALIIRDKFEPQETTFVTPPESQHQIGFVVYGAGGKIPRHVHRPLERKIRGTSEVIMVKRGACEVDIYDPDNNVVATRLLRTGDMLVLINCGHGFRMTEDTVLVEVKQGPYLGEDEKERF